MDLQKKVYGIVENQKCYRSGTVSLQKGTCNQSSRYFNNYKYKNWKLAVPNQAKIRINYAIQSVFFGNHKVSSF